MSASQREPGLNRWIQITMLLVAIVVTYFAFSAVSYWVAGHVASMLIEWVPPSVTLAVVNMVTLMLVGVMILATLLTLAERKWSAFMQDRVGPNRARISILPGLGNSPLGGLPHVLADSLKMLTKEGFRPASASALLFELAPVLNFAPIFCLFAVVPVGPEVIIGIVPTSLQVMSPDFGVLYIFALASIAVYGTALAGWASNNKFALLGGVRATSQMISYEVALGLSLVGMMMVCNTLKLDEMVTVQGAFIWKGELFRGFEVGLPAWGIFIQPLGFILFFTAGFAETKRAPFDLPEGESEVIGYFLEYSGMGFGLFMITEFVEVVVLAGVTTAVFLGGYHLPFGEEWVKHVFDNVTWAPGWLASILSKLWAPFLALVFWLKVIFLVYIQLAVRWSFPRFRYDQIQNLGWKMLLPAGIFNVFVSGALVLWDPSLKALAVMGILEILALVMLIPASQPDAHGHAPAAAGGHGGH